MIISFHGVVFSCVTGNCVTIHNLADRYSLEQVKDCSVKFIRWMFIHMTEDQLMLLTFEQMLSHVASDELVCSTEWDLFNKVSITTILQSFNDG